MFQLLHLGPILVGIVFLVTAAIKAFVPQSFQQHMLSLKIVSVSTVSIAVSLIAGFEGAWSIALITGTAERVVLPLTLLLLVAMSTISLWGVRSGRASDCGCYGGYIQPSVQESLVLNGTFFILCSLPLLYGSAGAEVVWWQLSLIFGVGIALFVLAQVSQSYARSHGRPLVDVNPLKPGRQFHAKWSGGQFASGEFLVAFLGTTCPHCAMFARIGNAIVQSPQLPPVFGVIASPESEIESFRAQNGIRFPVKRISESLMGRLVTGFPTVVLVEDSIIRDVWMGEVPPTFAMRFRSAFFPNALIGAES